MAAHSVPEEETVLRLRGITKRFGPLVANDSISFSLARGEVIALLGENGAGKTTLMNILFGHYTADEGSVDIFGQELPPGDPHAALAAGIGMVHQHFTLAEQMTVLENIALGTQPVFAWRFDKAAARKRIDDLARDFGLDVRPDAVVSDLSVGERQRVEILKALYRDARILILDEPTAVLTPLETEALFRTLKMLVANGLSIIFISHKLGEVMAVSDRVLVLRSGRLAGERRTAATDRHELAQLMVGGEVRQPPFAAQIPGPVVLSLRRVSVSGQARGTSLDALDLDLCAGEITGIAGVSGNGQAAIAGLLAGTILPDRGDIAIHGKTVAQWSPRAALANRIGRIPEDRHATGMIGDMSVTENVISEAYRTRRFSRSGFLDWKAARDFAKRIIADYDVKCPSPEARVRLLSGGNMQKLILGRALDGNPDVILANQPTRGLDVGAVAYVHGKLLEARLRGAAILLISEDLDEILALSDRVIVMSRGRLSAPSRRGERSVKEIGALMAGHGLRRRIMRLEPKPGPSKSAAILYPAGAIAATLFVASLLVMAAGANPFDVFRLVAKGAAGSQFALLETLTRATPLIFTGLAVAVAFRARLWNIGAEAQLYLGAVMTVVLGTGAVTLPSLALVSLILVAAMTAGALLLLGPAVLKVRFGVDEVVTTLLINFIILLVVSMLLEGPLKDPTGLGWPQSKKVIAEAQLPRLIKGKRLHFGFVLAIGAAIVTWVIMKKTTLGYEMRAVGNNAQAAAFAGIPVNAVLMKTALLSGGLAALAGFSEVAGLKGNLTLDLSPGYGYSGIVVAMLAMLNPLGVVAAAIFVAGIFVGADAMSRSANVPSYIAQVMVATALLTMVTAIMLSRYRIRWR